RILPTRRYGIPDRRHRGGNRHLVRGDEGTAAGPGRRAEIGPGNRLHQQHGWFWGAKSHRKLWTPVYRVKTAENARQRGSRDRAPATAITADSGHAGI